MGPRGPPGPSGKPGSDVSSKASFSQSATAKISETYTNVKSKKRTILTGPYLGQTQQVF